MASTTGSPQRVVFINRFFYPDRSATSQILSDLAFALAKAGFVVTVITSQRATSTNVFLPRGETIGDVEILRVATQNFRSSNLFGRAIEYLEFYAGAISLLFSTVGRGDILVAKTDPPLISVLAAVVARLRRAKLVNWLQDLYPEVAEQLGVPFAGGATGWVLRRARDSALHSARVNVAIGSRMAALLRKRHLSSKQIEVIPNWVDDGQIQPLPGTENVFLQKVAKNGEFVVGYSTNFARF